jgi:hypothetical protein
MTGDVITWPVAIMVSSLFLALAIVVAVPGDGDTARITGKDFVGLCSAYRGTVECKTVHVQPKPPSP